MTSLTENTMALLHEWKEKFINLSFKRYLLVVIVFLVVFNIFSIIFRIRAGYDFLYFYSPDAVLFLSPLVPYVHYIPWYPLLADLYFVLFALLDMNVILARIVQTVVLFACFLVMYDLMTLLNIKKINWHLIWFVGSPILLLYVLFTLNFDVLMILFLLLALDCFLRKNPALAGLFIGLGIMVKIFPIILFVPLSLYYIRNKQFKDIILLFISTIGIYFLCYLPFSVIRVVMLNQPFYALIGNYIFFFLAPLMMPEGHPLSLPYFFFLPLIPYTPISKSFLKLIANALAVSLLVIYCSWQLRKKRDPIETVQDVIIPGLFIFFMFQPYMPGWYTPWILAPRYLRNTPNPFRENYIYQPYILFSNTVTQKIHYDFNTYVIGDLLFANFYEFPITPSLVIPMFINFLGVTLKQVTALLIMLDESPKRRYIVLPIAVFLTVLSYLGLVYFFLFYYA
ncbi:MAG: glycosyltransferase 87 family protein [Candidatus Helarchaeota archaeon]